MGRKKSVVIGQGVDPSKLSLAKQFRREMTPAELTLWKALRNNQVDGLHFRRQQIIAGFIVAFYCHAAHLVIEADGEVHQSTAKYDQERARLCAGESRVSDTAAQKRDNLE
jgi:very-short-patch-repair endonuclease